VPSPAVRVGETTESLGFVLKCASPSPFVPSSTVVSAGPTTESLNFVPKRCKGNGGNPLNTEVLLSTTADNADDDEDELLWVAD